jgi:hypothetical protein
MKTVIFNSENPVVTYVKRSIYSFQVLMVGVAIPFFFLFGISDGNHKSKVANTEKEVSKSNSKTPDNVYQMNMPGI